MLDTSILLRAFDRSQGDFASIRQAIRKLWQRSEPLVVALQNIAEFWNVSTRPVKNNGFGLTPQQIKRRVQTVEALCSVITESPDSYVRWKE